MKRVVMMICVVAAQSALIADEGEEQKETIVEQVESAPVPDQEQSLPPVLPPVAEEKHEAVAPPEEKYEPAPLLSSPSSLEIDPYRVFRRSPPAAELKLGYFFFLTSQMSDVYNNGGYEIELSGSYPIYECLQIYANLGFLQAFGKSENGNQKTMILEVPVDLGLKSIFKLNRFTQYFIGIGPRYFYAHQHNHSSYVDQGLHKHGWGCFVNTGFNFFCMKNLFVDIFGEYAYQPAHFASSQTNVFGGDVQLSILTFGLGVGYTF